jgi:hypothetical protein
MKESIRDMLAREAAEAKAVADAEVRGERRPAAPGQRARRQPGEASQVYSVRIPVDRLAQLRQLADERGVAPTALLRQFVLERLDQETAPIVPSELPARDPKELRLGPSRNAPAAAVIELRPAR